MVHYQTFRGSDVHEALFAVREALGADALIESTRHVSNGQGGIFGRSFVEVVAAPSTDGGQAGSRKGPPRAAKNKRPAPMATLGPGRQNPVSLERELAALRTLVDELSAGRPPRERARAMLYAAGFEGELAKRLVTGATKAARGGRELLRDYLRRRIAERITVAPRLIHRASPQVIACVGPTGVGKTTTLAKLAARAKLDLHKSVTVISLDTFRVGAVEQWRRYAELIGINFGIAEDVMTFERLVRLYPSDLTLVDTAGKGFRGEASALRLKECLHSVHGLHREVQLVLPAWIRARDAERIVASHRDPSLTGLIITKMDEAEQLGGCLHPALTEQLPVTYLCDGARVPEDIHDAADEAILDAIFPGKE